MNIVAHALNITGVALLCTVGNETPAFVPYISLAILGAGAGATVVTLLMGLLSATKNREQSTVQAAAWSIKSTGMTVGLTVASAVFHQSLRARLQRTPSLSSSGQDVVERLQSNLEVINGLDPELRSVAQLAYIGVVRSVFFVTVGGMCLAGVISMMMRNNRLSSQPETNVVEKEETSS
jgi:hypothetical protein